MKYLKLFEEVDLFNYEDIKDILLEVEDLGYKAILQREQILTSDFFYIRIFKMAPESVKFEEVKDCLLRLKDYAGDRFIDFSVFVGTGRFPGHNLKWISMKLDKDTKLGYDIIDQCLIKISKNSKSKLYESYELSDSIKKMNKKYIEFAEILTEEIDSHWSEKYSKIIDCNIIDDAKDMALEYLDENINNVLIIEIKYEMYNPRMRGNLDSIDIYSCIYRYKNLKEDLEYEKNLSAIKKIDVNNIKYNFYIYEIIEKEYQYIEEIQMKETYEIQERLKSLYHNKINDIIEEHNGRYRFARRLNIDHRS